MERAGIEPATSGLLYRRSLADPRLGELAQHERVALLRLAPVARVDPPSRLDVRVPHDGGDRRLVGTSGDDRNEASERRKSCETRSSPSSSSTFSRTRRTLRYAFCFPLVAANTESLGRVHGDASRW